MVGTRRVSKRCADVAADPSAQPASKKGKKKSVSDTSKQTSTNGTNSLKKTNSTAIKDEPIDVDEPSTSTGIVARGRRTKAATKPVSYNDDSEDDMDDKTDVKKKATATKSKTKGKAASTKSKAIKKEKEEPPKKSGVERKLVKKGRAAVDSHCSIAASSHVYEEGDDIWDCMLNQTNIQFNNNKYYLIQLLEDDKGGVYSVWMRWGRVGANGMNSLKPCGSNLNQAKNIFEKKFNDKTKNDWVCRDIFDKVPGKYDLVHMDYSAEEPEQSQSTDQTDGVKKEKKEVVSELESGVLSLVQLICNIKVMEAAVVEMKYDPTKAPLGKLTKEQIKAGYLALQDITNIITSRSGKSSDNKALLQACNDFYTRIPHYFGMKVPPMIRTAPEVKQKLELLQALGDIQAAMSFLNLPSLDDGVHPADRHYSGLQCCITTLDHGSNDFKLISKYVSLNHGKTHSSYKLVVEEVFVCEKNTEKDRFLDSVGNRMLLWHGSRLSNWAGILSQGLRIAPPEAPVTGYMFGKGLYFADMCSKSANYCMASGTNTTGLMTLCEVALGKSNDLLQADYRADKLPSGCNSVKGVGSVAPQPKNFVTLDDGVIVPLGPAKENKTNHSLIYNEFIVYNPAQVRLRFLVKVKFDFNNSWV